MVRNQSELDISCLLGLFCPLEVNSRSSNIIGWCIFLPLSLVFQNLLTVSHDLTLSHGADQFAFASLLWPPLINYPHNPFALMTNIPKQLDFFIGMDKTFLLKFKKRSINPQFLFNAKKNLQ